MRKRPNGLGGWILGGRAIDCPENGGMGFVPQAQGHFWSGLGISTRRTECPGEPRPDHCYAIKCSVVDSDTESEPEPVGVSFAKLSGGVVQPSDVEWSDEAGEFHYQPIVEKKDET